MILNSVSIFIPVHNEENTLRGVVNGLESYLEGESIEYEILILDDASCDGSFMIMKELSEQSQKVKYFHFSLRQGLGNMMKKGYELASKEWVMMISADGQFKPNYCRLYFECVDKADIIAGNRVDRYKRYSLARQLVSIVFNYISRYFFGVPIHDIGWTKLVRKDVLREINLKRTGAIVELELLVKALLHNFSIHEVIVPFMGRSFGKSKCFNAQCLISSFISLVVLYFEVVLLTSIKCGRAGYKFRGVLTKTKPGNFPFEDNQ